MQPTWMEYILGHLDMLTYGSDSQQQTHSRHDMKSNMAAKILIVYASRETEFRELGTLWAPQHSA
jgi:hypothetical protein